MKILSLREIKDMPSWKMAFCAIDKKNWKEGRSAHALAEYFLSHNGEAGIVEKLNAGVLEDDSIECLDEGIIELECPFDAYSHPRRQDMGIWGKTRSGKSIFIGVEAKVDEPFGDTIADARKRGEKANSNLPARINGLCSWLGVSEDDEKIQKLRYQLFYFTKGTADVDADICVLLSLTFKTSEYDENKAKENKADWDAFIGHFFDAVSGGHRLKSTICAKPVYAVSMTVDLP